MRVRKSVVLLASAALAMLVVCGVAWADTFTVRNTNDSGPGSLRAAIINANTNVGKDLITFAPSVGGNIGLQSVLPELRGELEIRGPGAGALTVRRAATESFRVFTIAQRANVRVSGLRLANGHATDGERSYCSCEADHGGGVLNEGALTLRGVVVSVNRARDGGGISNAGELALSGVKVSANTSGGIRNTGILTLRDATVSANRGGGISSINGTLTVEGSTLSENVGGGGIFTYVRANPGTLPEDAGETTIRDSTFSENRSRGHGGGINVGAGVVTVEGSTFYKNIAGWAGGGISNCAFGASLTVKNSTFAGNRSEESPGGGIDGCSNMTVEGSTFTNNRAPAGGGIAFGNGDPKNKAILRMNIVAGNEAREGPDVYSRNDYPFTSGGFNLIGDAHGSVGFGPTDLRNTGAGLDPDGLQDNGGSTRTIALMPDSPALDAVEAGCSPPDKDQRGVSRPQDGDGDGEAKCDIGSYERQAPPSR